MPHPRLLVRAGASLSSLADVDVNAATPHAIKSDLFEGAVSVRIVDFLGPKGRDGNPQPAHAMRDGATMSIAIQGRWKEAVEADDVMWGNFWQKPIRDYLPYGTAAALKFVHLVDPALAHDVYADQPWALSPLLATLNYLDATRVEPSEPLPPFNPSEIEENAVPLFKGRESEVSDMHGKVPVRKRFMNDANKRKTVKIEPDVVVTGDFCNGYIDFSSLSLKLPIGLHFELEKYWDGQPVTFVCRNRSGSKEYFFVTFQIEREGKKTTESKPVATQQPENLGGKERDEMGVD